ncbi:MAG: glutamate synthase subunit beta [Ignavibacteriales bacterium]|nr:MAG: glutamate synthase subunit beta [Ignavibacteriales bacterium]
MAKIGGYLQYERINPPKTNIEDRIKNFDEFEQLLAENELTKQAARCMDCGIPFCHSFGCPCNNKIPDWNEMVYRNHWKKALELLHSTINFPEFTGRVCPAPCEYSCTLAINRPAVSIKHIELQIVEKGWKEGWIQPEIPLYKSGKRIAVVGSGPSGLAAAQQLARAGHEVVVFEKSDRIGGLLRYGIPDFKLEKKIIDRRLNQMEKEGIVFETGVNVGIDISARYLNRTFDAVVIAAGSTIPRDINIPGRELNGIYFAMKYLMQQNKINAGDEIPEFERISAKDKNVIVIGGGDTGSDCVGTANRQGAKSVTQVEILPKPADERMSYNPWPYWPLILHTSSSHIEGCERNWSLSAKQFEGDGNNINKIIFSKLEWSDPDAKRNRNMIEVPNSEFSMKADLVLLAMGFVHVEHGPLVNDLGLLLDERGNIKTDNNFMSSARGFFATGDTILGASLVVKAIKSGRDVAEKVHQYLS